MIISLSNLLRSCNTNIPTETNKALLRQMVVRPIRRQYDDENTSLGEFDREKNCHP